MKIVLKISILLLILSCSNKQSSESHNDTIKIDTLSFASDGFNHHRKLDLLSNQKFILFESLGSCFGDTRIERHFGDYQMTDSSLVLNPKKVEIQNYSGFSEEKGEKKIVQYGSDSLIINTNYQLFEWKNKEYLLSERFDSLRNFDFTNDYEKFAHYFNTGREPENSGNYLIRIKMDSSSNTSWNINKIPIKWRSKFQKESISVKIIDRKKEVQQDWYNENEELVSWRIKINKGVKDGVRNGLHFSTKDGEFFIDIDSTQNSVSYGSCFIFNLDEKLSRIGTELRTKWD